MTIVMVRAVLPGKTLIRVIVVGATVIIDTRWIHNLIVSLLLEAALVVLSRRLALPFAIFFNSQYSLLSNDSFKFQSCVSWNGVPVLNFACLSWADAFADSQDDQGRRALREVLRRWRNRRHTSCPHAILKHTCSSNLPL
jgi:hypothetical protein